MAGILAITPYYETNSAVSTRALATSVNVSGKAQNNLGESTHPIGKTISMQMMTTSSSGADEATYVKTPTWGSRRVPQWYMSIMSNLETHTGTLAGSASHISRRMRGKLQPNYIDSGSASLSVVLLTLSVPLQVFSDRLGMRRRRQYTCGTAAIQDSLSLSPNTLTTSLVGRMMPKLSCTCRCISL